MYVFISMYMYTERRRTVLVMMMMMMKSGSAAHYVWFSLRCL